jgi:hypothetical protein
VLQVVDVPGMHDIEAAVAVNDGFAGFATAVSRRK